MTSNAPPRRRRLALHHLVLGVVGLTLLAPVVALLSFRVYQTQLLNQTEASLIAESVWIAEAFRSALQAEGVVAVDASPRPPNAPEPDFYPVEPRLDPAAPVLPRLGEPRAVQPLPDTPVVRAGARLNGTLGRAKRFTLSGVRVLDAEGLVVATSGGELGASLADMPEVRGALAGTYTVVGRERVSDEPAPPLSSIRRRGRIRLFTALPVFADGQLVGVVRMSRTGLDAVEALWRFRDTLLVVAATCVALSLGVGFALWRAVAGPVRALRSAAADLARGQRGAPFVPRGFVPAELAELGQSLEDLTRQLTERADYVTQFAADTNHELKTPIAALRGAAELMADTPDMAPEQRARFLTHMLEDAHRIERTVSRLLSLARLENPLPRGPDQPGTTLSALILSLRERHGDRVQCALDPRLPPRIGLEPEVFETVLGNLLDNALRHGGDAPVSLRFLVGTGPSGVTLEVEDHGPGISEGNRGRVFQRFFTTERARGGTGLGLAIVAAVVRARGGTVDFESRPGRTVFRARL